VTPEVGSDAARANTTTNGGGSVIAGDVPVPVLAAPPPVSLLVTLLAGNPVTSITVVACLTTPDVNTLRRLHPALPAAVAAVPWADTDAAVVNVVRWRKVLPVAVGTRFTRRAVGDPERAAAALAGVTNLDLQGGAFVRAKLLDRLPTSALRVLNVSNCRNLANNTSFTRFTALEVLNCSRTKVIDDWAGGLPTWLRELDISFAIGLWYCVSLEHLSTLRVLRATGSAVGDATLASLQASLVELHAAKCWCLSQAASFAHLPALRVLEVSECRIGDASLASLPPSLVHLDVRMCYQLTPAATVHHLPGLQWLDASYTAVGDALVASLPAGLVELRLISCYSVTCGATLDHLPALRVLHCGGTRLDHTVLAACRVRGCDVPAAMQLLFGSHYQYNGSTLSVLADGRLACASSSTMQVWDVARAVGTAAVVISAQGGRDIKSLAALPDGRLAVGTGSGPWSSAVGSTIEVWDVNAGPPVRCTIIDFGSGGSVYALAALRNGRLAARRSDNNVWIIDLEAGAVAAVLEGHTDTVVSLVALPDGRLASGSRDKTVRVWDVGARACVATLAGHTGIVWNLAVLADGQLASGAGDGTVRLWDVGAATCVDVLPGLHGYWLALAALPDGRLAIGSKSGTGNCATIWLWDTRPAAAASSSRAVSMLDLREFVSSIWKMLLLQDGRLACAGRPRYEATPNALYELHVHLLEVPPPSTC